MWDVVSLVASLAAKNRYDWRYAGLRSVLSVREDVIRGGGRRTCNRCVFKRTPHVIHVKLSSVQKSCKVESV